MKEIPARIIDEKEIPARIICERDYKQNNRWKEIPNKINERDSNIQ